MMTPSDRAALREAASKANVEGWCGYDAANAFCELAHPAAVLALLDECERMREALAILLDHVDYTNGACGAAELVGGALPVNVIKIARAALGDGA